MFFDLKEVLQSQSPVRRQSQCGGHAGLRRGDRLQRSAGGQSEGAAQVGWAPEQLSPAKFYPKVATATYLYLHRQQWEARFGPGTAACTFVSSAAAVAGSGRHRSPVQVEHRADHRRTRRFCPARRH